MENTTGTAKDTETAETAKENQSTITDAADTAVEEKLSELYILKQSLDEAKEQAATYLDQLKKLTAEFENYRKRAEKEFSLYRQRGKIEILMRIIKFHDILERAENMITHTKDQKVIAEGVAMIKTDFARFLREEGVIPLLTVGYPFDPNKHEAIGEVESEHPEGTIAEEVLKGYVYGNVVIRPAQVKLAKKRK